MKLDSKGQGVSVRALWCRKINALPKHAIQDYVESSKEVYHLRKVGINPGECWSRMLEAYFSNFLLLLPERRGSGLVLAYFLQTE